MARISTPRVKTGCITCRIRRVKCDEGKPFCQRCLATGRKCDGYTAPQHKAGGVGQGGSRNGENGLGESALGTPCPPTSAATSASSRRALVPATPLPVLMTAGNYSLPFRVPGSQRDRQLLHYFCVQGGRDIGGYMAPDFWTRTVLQASHDEPAVRHAVVALSSLHLQYVASDSGQFLLSGHGQGGGDAAAHSAASQHGSSPERWSTSPPNDGQTPASTQDSICGSTTSDICLGMADATLRAPSSSILPTYSRPKVPAALEQEALRNYGRALRALQKRIDRPNPVESGDSTSSASGAPPRGVTLVCCAVLCAFESALGNAEGALRHVENGLRILASSDGRIDRTHLEGLEDLVEVFMRLDVQAAMFDDRRIPFLQLVTPTQRRTTGLPTLNDATPFPDFATAQCVAVQLQNWLVRLMVGGKHMWEWPLEQLPPAVLIEKALLSRQIQAWQDKTNRMVERYHLEIIEAAEAKAQTEAATAATEDNSADDRSGKDLHQKRLQTQRRQRQRQPRGKTKLASTSKKSTLAHGQNDASTADSPDSSHAFNFVAVKVLSGQMHIMHLLLRSNFPNDFAPFRTTPNYELRALLDTYEEILRDEGALGGRSNMNTSENKSNHVLPGNRSFSSEVGVVAALFVLVVKAIDEEVCTRATRLLMSLHRREGLHDADVLSSSVHGLGVMRSLVLGETDKSTEVPPRWPLEDWANNMMDAVRVGEDNLA